MIKVATAIPRPESAYLDSLLKIIKNFSETPVSDLVALRTQP